MNFYGATDWSPIFNEIKQRFPDFNPTDAQQADWRRAIGTERLINIQEALYRLVREKSPKIPKLPDVLKHLAEIKKRNARIGDPSAPSRRQLNEIEQATRDKARALWLERIKAHDENIIDGAREIALDRYWYHTCLNKMSPDQWTLGACVAVMYILDEDQTDRICESGGILALSGVQAVMGH